MSKDLILIRGRGGEAFARMLVENFVSDIGYVDSYDDCAKQDVIDYMAYDIPTIIVYGTYTTLYPYHDVAKENGYIVTTLTCETNNE